MDTKSEFYSTTEVAGWLGVSVPTIHRAIPKLKLKPVRITKGHLRLSKEDVRLLLKHLGKVSKICGFSREEILVLKVLLTRPFGLRSARSVARNAGVSPTTALKALHNLEQRSMVEYRQELVAEGTVKEIGVWILRLSPFWITDNLVMELRNTILPSPACPKKSDAKIPRYFKHLFWNVDLKKLNTRDYGPAIAIRVIEQDNPHALAWAIGSLDREAFSAAALPRRGFTPEMSALASHIASRK